MTYHDGQEPPTQPDEPPVEQLGICTRDHACTAAVDQHLEDCPVEQRLRDEIGF